MYSRILCIDRSWKQELVQRSGRSVAYMFAPPSIAYSASFLIELSTTRLVMTSPTMDWALPHQSQLKKVPYILVCTLVLWKHFLNWGFLLSNNFNLHQVYMKQPSSVISNQGLPFSFNVQLIWMSVTYSEYMEAGEYLVIFLPTTCREVTQSIQ